MTDSHSPDATKGAETPTCSECGYRLAVDVLGRAYCMMARCSQAGKDVTLAATPSTGADTPDTRGPWEVSDAEILATLEGRTPPAAVPAGADTRPLPDAEGCGIHQHPCRQCFAGLLAGANTLRETLRDIRDNYDHDEDAHKYGTRCRVCIAVVALGEVGPRESWDDRARAALRTPT